MVWGGGSRLGLNSEDCFPVHENATLGRQATHSLEEKKLKDMCLALGHMTHHRMVFIVCVNYLSSSATKDLDCCPETQRKKPSSQQRWSHPKLLMGRAVALNESRQRNHGGGETSHSLVVGLGALMVLTVAGHESHAP